VNEDVKDEQERIIAFQGELWLRNWKENADGREVSFGMPVSEEDSTHPFRQYMSAGGRGTRFYAVLVAMDDNDQPVDSDRRAKVHAALDEHELKGGKISQQAGRMCKDPYFHDYVAYVLLDGSEPQDRRDLARQMPYWVVSILRKKGRKAFADLKTARDIATYYVYSMCDIRTRKTLDHNVSAKRRWQAYVLEPYHHWLGQ